jgi:hypothetical protein
MRPNSIRHPFDKLRAGLPSSILVFLCVLSASAVSSPARGEETPIFPLMPWNSPPNDPAVLKKIHDCGLTVAGFVPPAALDNCQAAGLKAIVSDNRLSNYDWKNVDPAKARENVTAVIKQVRNHPAVYGYYLRDEPSADFFKGLAIASDVIKEQHPGAWPYINLFPNYAEPWQLATPDYQTYLDKFIEVCKPPVLSYDHYALYQGGGFNEAYFVNLEQMRALAAKNKIPFWNIVLSVGCLNFRECSQTDLRFEVYTSLAYGARGIAYFTYFTPEVGNFRMAPIDQFGHETQTWQWMRNVNLQVGKLAPTLLKLKSDRAYHFGKVPKGCAGPDENSLIKSAPGNLLVGDFTHEDGTRYVLCVNKDFNANLVLQPQFRQPVSKIQIVSPYSGQLVPFEGEQCWLAPGQGMLLKLVR